MRIAAIDIGTNSVLLTVVERDAAGTQRIELDRCTITRLGQGVDRTRRLAPEAMTRTLDCLAAYAKVLEALQIDRLGVVGTSALRDAQEADGFLRSASAVLGVTPQIIGGSEEAALTFRGALSQLNIQGPVVVVDVGGGSTEIITGTATMTKAVAEHCCSLDVGCVRLTERYVVGDPPDTRALTAIAESTSKSLSALPFEADRGTAVAVAGTATTLAAIEGGFRIYDGTLIHGQVLSIAQLHALVARLSVLEHAERAALRGMEPRRADVIVAGAVILVTTLSELRHDSVIVSDRGVRFGLIESMLDEALTK